MVSCPVLLWGSSCKHSVPTALWLSCGTQCRGSWWCWCLRAGKQKPAPVSSWRQLKTLLGQPLARSRVSHTLTSSTSVEVLGWRLCFAPACHCVAEGDGLVCGMKKGNAETFPRAVAEPVCPCAGWGANLEVQPFAFCV